MPNGAPGLDVENIIKELLDLADKRIMFTYGKVDLTVDIYQILSALLGEADRCDIYGALDSARKAGRLEETIKTHAGKKFPEERIKKYAEEFGPDVTGDPWPLIEEAVDRAITAAGYRFEQNCGLPKRFMKRWQAPPGPEPGLPRF